MLLKIPNFLNFTSINRKKVGSWDEIKFLKKNRLLYNIAVTGHALRGSHFHGKTKYTEKMREILEERKRIEENALGRRNINRDA